VLPITHPYRQRKFATPGRCIAALAAALLITGPAGAIAARALPPPSPPAHPPQAHPSTRTLEVTGNGEAHVAPNLAFLNLAIETHAATAQEAAGSNAALAQKVVAALTKKLAGKGKVWTGGYSLYPEYSEAKPGEKPTVTGYRADNSITVRTGEISTLGALIDTAIDAGANRINYLRFTLSDESKARSQAIALAAKDAQSQAESLAKALGVKLGPIIKATTTAQVRPMAMMRMGAMIMARGATPVQPSEVNVPATVSVTYRIE
jgi:uncharacterized protein YggE